MKQLFVVIALLFSTILFSQDSMFVHYKIYDTKAKQTVRVEKIVSQMINADVLFLEKSITTALAITSKIKS
ncbi:MAG: hypothetical protein IPM85_02150 [Chitinophagaceae bacterium]|nr:hypothetical protein [Chitinophagaceae bacterium]